MAGNFSSVFARSGIPYGFEGRITSIERRLEKHPGVDDVWLVAIDGKAVHLDSLVAESLRAGDVVSKERLSARLRTPREQVRLQPSRDFWGMVFLTVFLGAAFLLLILPNGSRDDRGGGSPSTIGP